MKEQSYYCFFLINIYIFTRLCKIHRHVLRTNIFKSNIQYCDEFTMCDFFTLDERLFPSVSYKQMYTIFHLASNVYNKHHKPNGSKHV